MDSMKIAIIGFGRVGRAFAANLSKNNMNVSVIVDPDNPDINDILHDYGILNKVMTDFQNIELCNGIIISVPDDSINDVIDKLHRSHVIRIPSFIVHTSGVKDLKCFKPLLRSGIKVGSLHPIYSFPKDTSLVPDFKALWFGVSCDYKDYKDFKLFLDKLGGVSIYIPENKRVPYHIAAVFSANFLFPLIYASKILYGEVGIGDDQQNKILLNLIQSVLRNFSNSELSGIWSGPLVRGDLQTIFKHMEYLSMNDDLLFKIYSQMMIFSSQILHTLSRDEYFLQSANEIKHWMKNRIDG